MGKLWRTTSSGKRVRTAAGVRHELRKFQSSAKAKADRASRNKARRQAIREGRAHVGDGTAVDHKNSNPMDDSSDNLRVMPKSKNAARHEDSRERGSTRDKKDWGKD